ncbi:hypothetical protein EVAR_9912_1 [Eumeta japonica]|uniref:Uncharacterized protein n=1 Tax=Eumeta variegata TaxID=151549 RepID=A0A4C1TQE5_EUMVA|nr:hypothetical protein EVAR_9912_1 [Eumeta japonica]
MRIESETGTEIENGTGFENECGNGIRSKCVAGIGMTSEIGLEMDIDRYKRKTNSFYARADGGGGHQLCYELPDRVSRPGRLIVAGAISGDERRKPLPSAGQSLCFKLYPIMIILLNFLSLRLRLNRTIKIE